MPNVLAEVVRSVVFFREFSLLPRILFFFGIVVAGISIFKELAFTTPVVIGLTLVSAALTLHYYGHSRWMHPHPPHAHHFDFRNLAAALFFTIVTGGLVIWVILRVNGIPIPEQMRRIRVPSFLIPNV